VSCPRPELGPTDVLVQVDAVSVNPVDTFVRSGRYATRMAFPFVVGHAIAPMVATGGQIVITAGRRPQPSTSLWHRYTRDIAVIGFVISRASAVELAAAAHAVDRRLAGPGFGVRVATELPIEETARAHERVEQGEAGRLVVRVAPRSG
jgi:NADPH:quinone reductase-like Zn-dependent oxidoreductase